MRTVKIEFHIVPEHSLRKGKLALSIHDLKITNLYLNLLHQQNENRNTNKYSFYDSKC